MGPMEEVDDEHVDGDIATLEFTGHVKHLVLVPVAQLALPESQPPFGHDRRMACRIGVMALDFGRGFSGRDPVVELTGGFRLPACAVLAEFRGADGGVVPQEAVSRGGHHERDLMEQLRTVRCGKTEFAQAFRMPGTGIVLTEHVGGHHKIAVGQGGHTGVFIDGNRDRIPSFMMLVEQSPIRVIDGHFLRCTNPHTVHAPRFDAQGLAFAPPFKRMPIDFHSHGSLSFHLASLSRPNHNFVEPVHIAKITQSAT